VAVQNKKQTTVYSSSNTNE